MGGDISMGFSIIAIFGVLFIMVVVVVIIISVIASSKSHKKEEPLVKPKYKD